MFSPGAEMPSHGPGMLNDDGAPAGPSAPTDSTYGCHQDGTDTEVTPDQSRGSAGLPSPPSGFGAQLPMCASPEPALPAAATMTASLSTAA